MKLGLFTDSHYSSQEITCSVRYNSKSLEKIKAAYSFFEKEKCDLIICLGDLIDHEEAHEKEIENLKKVADIINNSPLKSICIMGNHDAFAFTKEEFYKILGGCEPVDITANGKNLVFLDACFFKNGNRYMPGDDAWYDTFLPDAELLKKTLDSLSGDTYIFMHQNVDEEIDINHRLFNSSRVCEIIENCGKVKTVFQGHYHLGNKSVKNGINYVTLPAMCQFDDAVFVVEI